MPYVFYIFIVLLLMTSTKGMGDSLRRYNCSVHKHAVITSIGVVINGNTRMGKEIKTAMEVAARDINKDSCNQITLHIRDYSSGSSVHATSIASKLIQSKKVEVIVGTFSLAEAVFLSELHKNFLGTPIILLTPIAMLPPLVPLPSNLIQFSHSFSIHMQCIAAIVGKFRWRRVVVISERGNLFAMDSALFSGLSDSLRSVDTTIEQHIAFPLISSLSNPENTIEHELHKLKSGSNRVFLLLHISLELVVSLFQKATQMGMLEKGFVWIVSDEIASLLDLVDSSVLASLQGVLGCKTSSNSDTSKQSYKEFKVKFKQTYVTKFPYDEGNPNPSLFGLRAYDVIHAISKAKGVAIRKSDHSNDDLFFHNLLLSNFHGLSGNVSFSNGELGQIPTFQIINVVGKSYMELAFWSPEFELSGKLHTQTSKVETRNQHQSRDKVVELGSIYWPGGKQDIPRGWNFSGIGEKPLRIGVPASGAFHLVDISTVAPNHTNITGFVIDVFNASLKYLPFDLSYELIPYHGRYDDMVHHIHERVFDVAVGDILILDERYKWADFSQPYVQSGMNMVVKVKEDNTKEMWIFTMVFEKKMWLLILSMGLFIGFVVWFVERRRNPEFAGGSACQQFGTVFWFSFSLFFFTQKESPRSNLSKMVLVPWYFLVVMLTVYFTAALTSLMTISQLLPSVNDVETLKRQNAVVGCNWNSFVCTYLVDVLHFKRENIKPMRSVEDYPLAFESGDIKAVFFVTLHEKIFLTRYCNGYTIAGPTYNFGGFGFAFHKGSALSAHMSQAILKATEKGEIESLEQNMFARYKCPTSTISNSTTYIGPKPFAGLFFISGGIAILVLLITVFPSVEQQWLILSVLKEAIVSRICARVSAMLLLTYQNRSRLPCQRPTSTSLS